MAMSNVNVRIDLGNIEQKIKDFNKEAQFILDQQVLKDSNYYAPMDTSELIRSSLRMSMIGQGLLMWDTPYARRLYYNPQYNFSHEKNPNAGGLWFENAKANHLSDWIKIIDALKKRKI